MLTNCGYKVKGKEPIHFIQNIPREAVCKQICYSYDQSKLDNVKEERTLSFK